MTKNKPLEECLKQKEAHGAKLRQVSNDLSELTGKYHAAGKRVIAISRCDEMLLKIRRALWSKFPGYACMAFRTFADALRAIDSYNPNVIIINDRVDSQALEHVVKFADKKNTKIVLVEDDAPPKKTPTAPSTERMLAPMLYLTLKNPMDLNEVARVLG